MTETITITQSIEQITVSSTGDTIVVSNAGVAPAPGTFTDNCIIRSNGTSGGSIQCSSVTLSDDGIFAGVKQVNAGLSAGLVLGNSNGAAVLTLGAGPGVGASFAGGVNIAGVLQNTDATDATNLTTASVVLSGGLAVTKQFRVGGAANLSENVTIATGKSLTVDTITATAATISVTKPIVVSAGNYIDAPTLRYGGTDILARANTWTARQTIAFSENGSLFPFVCRNTSNGTAAIMRAVFSNDAENGFDLRAYSSTSTATALGEAMANAAFLSVAGSGPTKLLLGTTTAVPVIIGVNNAARIKIPSGSATEIVGSTFVSGGTATTAGATEVTVGAGVVDVGVSLRYRGTKVVGAQGAAVADATDATSVIARLNDLLARMRAHGLIAT